MKYINSIIYTMLHQEKEKVFILGSKFDPTLLTTEREEALLKQLAEFPSVIKEAAKREAPYRVTQYVFDLASLLHSFYNAEKVINEANPQLTKARIALMKAVQITLANALNILGVSAPNKM